MIAGNCLRTTQSPTFAFILTFVETRSRAELLQVLLIPDHPAYVKCSFLSHPADFASIRERGEKQKLSPFPKRPHGLGPCASYLTVPLWAAAAVQYYLLAGTWAFQDCNPLYQQLGILRLPLPHSQDPGLAQNCTHR